MGSCPDTDIDPRTLPKGGMESIKKYILHRIRINECISLGRTKM